MRFDRDLNVAVVRTYWPDATGGRRGWEMLAATGVRGLRLVEETDAFDRFDFTERNPAAVGVLGRNLHESGHSGLTAHSADARSPPERGAFDYVDLDPFGTPAPFTGAALDALAPAALLAVTATDMPVLTGVARGVAWSRYGARPIRGAQGPEGALRILLAYLVRGAADRSIELSPLLGYVHDHYVRAYLVARRRSGAGRPVWPIGDPSELGDSGPQIRGTGPFGPLWLGPLFDAGFVARLQVPATAADPRGLERFLDRVRDEAAADRPFYYEPNELASELGLSEPPALDPLLSALRSEGFAAGRTHVRPSAFRTTAPRTVVYRIAHRVAGRT